MATYKPINAFEPQLRALLRSDEREAAMRLVKQEVSNAFVDGLRLGTKVAIAQAKRKREARQQRTT